MEETLKDRAQDAQIRANAERILRNEEAIRRQTEALEKICDHYYPQRGWFKKSSKFFVKVVCIIVAYLGIAETVDWIWTTRESEALARRYAAVGRRLFFEDGNADGAARCFEKAVELDDGESKYKIALIFMNDMSVAAEFIGQDDRPLTEDESAQVSTALAEANMLAELEPGNPLPLVLKAQSLLLLGDFSAAVEAVGAAVALDPARAPVRVSACAFNFFAGRGDEARKHLSEAERLDPSLPLVQYWKGMFALKLDRDAASAREAFSAMVKMRPRLAIGHAMLGRARLVGDKPDVKAARSAFERALMLDCRQKIALLGIAETHERDGNLRVARIWLDRTLQNAPRFLPALVARARVSGKIGDFGSALDDLTSAIGLAPFRAELYRLRADVHDAIGEKAKAGDDRATAIELEGNKK